MSRRLEDLVYGMIERWWAARHVERHALVSSYDPKRYLAKVTLQPEGQETGWLPIETGHIGQDYGIVVGLQPGQAGVSSQGQGGTVGQQSQNQGDQVIVRFQEGDVESGKIVQRIHSDQDTPPQAQSGEMIFYTRFQKSDGDTPDAASGGQGGTGQQIYFKNDGSITFTDGNGGTLVFDGQGNCNLNCKKLTIQTTDDRTLTIGGTDNVSITKDKNVTIKGKRNDIVSGNWMAQAAFGIWSWLLDDDG